MGTLLGVHPIVNPKLWSFSQEGEGSIDENLKKARELMAIVNQTPPGHVTSPPRNKGLIGPY